jgi:hypothetical protein
MKLPNGEQAIIDIRKLTEYCLSPVHEDGQHKARLFATIAGLTTETADELVAALEQAAIEHEASLGKCDQYGQRYIIDFEHEGPKERTTIRSVWIVRSGEFVPRLVTCYIL